MLFIYKALTKEGRETQGELQATNRQVAIEYLQRDNLTPLFIEEKGSFEKRKASIFNFTFGNRVSALDRMFLTRHLSAILKSGINLREALEILEDDVQKPIMKKILKDARINLERGQPLSVTFQAYEKHFSSVFIGLVKAGEVSGNLEGTLENLGMQLQRDYDLKKRVQSAMIYPLILLGASSLIVVLLLTFVMPRLIKALTQAKVVLPLITRVLIGLSKILSANLILTIIVFLALIISAITFFQNKQGRQFFISIMERLPVSKNLIKKLALSRFAITLRNLLNSGVSAVEALNITAKTIGNEKYERALLDIEAELRKGAPLHEVFKKRGNLFPHLVISVIAVGERTGTLENSLKAIFPRLPQKQWF